MDPAPRVMTESGRESAAPRPVDAPETEAEKQAVDEESVEVMAANSPEGRPPHLHEKRRTGVVIIAGALIFVVAAVILVLTRGWTPLGIGLLLMVGLIGAAFPVWLAALYRRKEEERAQHQAEATVRPDHPPRPV